MTVTLNNELLQISFETKGAQLVSLKKDGVEHIWEPDPKYWGGCAPVLFPMVSSVIFILLPKILPVIWHQSSRQSEKN